MVQQTPNRAVAEQDDLIAVPSTPQGRGTIPEDFGSPGCSGIVHSDSDSDSEDKMKANDKPNQSSSMIAHEGVLRQAMNSFVSAFTPSNIFRLTRRAHSSQNNNEPQDLLFGTSLGQKYPNCSPTLSPNIVQIKDGNSEVEVGNNDCPSDEVNRSLCCPYNPEAVNPPATNEEPELIDPQEKHNGHDAEHFLEVRVESGEEDDNFTITDDQETATYQDECEQWKSSTLSSRDHHRRQFNFEECSTMVAMTKAPLATGTNDTVASRRSVSTAPTSFASVHRSQPNVFAEQQWKIDTSHLQNVYEVSSKNSHAPEGMRVTEATRRKEGGG